MLLSPLPLAYAVVIYILRIFNMRTLKKFKIYQDYSDTTSFFWEYMLDNLLQLFIPLKDIFSRLFIHFRDPEVICSLEIVFHL